jgi:vesicle coat complex subunit
LSTHHRSLPEEVAAPFLGSCPKSKNFTFWDDSYTNQMFNFQTNQEGKLLQEMILVCDAYRKDLLHPNEYVRGSTLRYLFMIL